MLKRVDVGSSCLNGPACASFVHVSGEEEGNIAASVREALPAPQANLGVQWKVCAALLAAWLTVLAFILPYDPDEAVYKIIATGIVHGKWPYHDLFDHKPPLIYFWYLPAGLGASIEAERILAALLVAASVPIAAVLARRWLTGRQVPLATAAYAILLANPFMIWGANAEAFLLLPLVAALAVPSPVLAGVLLGFAVMTKPVALAFAPVLMLLWRRDVWRVAIGGGLVSILVSLPFIPIWHDFWEANVTFNLDYGRNLGYGNGLYHLLIPNPGVLIGGLPLWCAALVGAIRQRDRLIWLWALCGLISVRASGLNFSHQYVLLVPPAALLAGIGFDRILRSRILAIIESILSAGVLAVVASALVLFGGAKPFQQMVDALRTAQGELMFSETEQTSTPMPIASLNGASSTVRRSSPDLTGAAR